MSNQSKPLIQFAGFVEDTHTGHRGIILAVIHADPTVTEAAAAYLESVVGPSMEKALPAIDAILKTTKAAQAAPKGVDKDQEATREAGIEAAVEAGSGMTEAQAAIDAVIAAVRASNPGSGTVQ